MVVGRLTVFLLHGRGAVGEAKTWAVHEGRPRTLGRAEDADIRSNCINVARRQAQVGMDREGPWVQDAQSPAGTFVDDGTGPRHIGGKRAYLDHGHRIVCGTEAWTVDCAREPAVGSLGVTDLGVLMMLAQTWAKAAGALPLHTVAIPDDIHQRLQGWITDEPRGRSLVLADLRQWLTIPGPAGLAKEVFLDSWSWVLRKDRRRTLELLRLTCLVETVDRMDPFSQQIERRTLTLDRVQRVAPYKWKVASLYSADDAAQLCQARLAAPHLLRLPVARPLPPLGQPVRDVPPRQGRAACRALLDMVVYLHGCGYQRLYVWPASERTDPVWRLELEAEPGPGDGDVARLTYCSDQGEHYCGRAGAVGLRIADLAAWFGEAFPTLLAAAEGDDPVNAAAAAQLVGELGEEDLPALPAEGDADPERTPAWVLWGRAEVVEIDKLPRTLRARRAPLLPDGLYQQHEDGWHGW